MPPKIFLCHHSDFAHEIRQLATEMRLRGLVPWVDKDGGFAVGDQSADEARRAIREECHGFVFYTTEDIFSRPFIRDVEVPAALDAKAADPSFILFAVPRGIGFSQLRRGSVEAFGFDLSPYHGMSVADDDRLQEKLAAISREVLRRALMTASLDEDGRLALQFSTRDLMPHDAHESLCINAAPHLSTSPGDTSSWERLLRGLVDAKQEIAARFACPRLRVEGSKHLTAAFMFGRVFSPMAMDIRLTPAAYWASDAEPSEDVLKSKLVFADGDPVLTVEIASRIKDVAAGVDSLMRSTDFRPAARLQLEPTAPPLNVDNAICCSMVRQAYREIERAVARQSEVRTLHLFSAVPQSFLMMLGREFKGLPPTQFYEWMGDRYVPSCLIPGGVLA